MDGHWLEFHLKANLKDVGKAVVNGRGRVTIFDPGPDIIKHEPGIRGQIPVQAGGNIVFSSAVDAGIVQVYI